MIQRKSLVNLGWLYLFGRGGNVGIATASAWIYTVELGPVGKGALAIILLISVLASEVFQNPLLLIIRHRNGSIDQSIGTRKFEVSYKGLAIFSMLGFVVSVSVLATLRYMNFLQIDSLSFIFSCVFILLSMAANAINEFLIAIKRIRVSLSLDFLSVTMQLAFLSFFLLSNRTVTILNCLVSFTLLSLVIILLGFPYISKKTFVKEFSDLNHPQLNLTDASFGLWFCSFVEKITLFIVFIIGGQNLFGQYTTMLAPFALLRFMPEALSRLIVARIVSIKFQIPISISFAGLVAVPSGFLIVILLDNFFGRQFVIPGFTIFFMAFSQILSAITFLYLNSQVITFNSISHKTYSVIATLIYVCICLVSALAIGVITLPLLLSIFYLILLATLYVRDLV